MGFGERLRPSSRESSSAGTRPASFSRLPGGRRTGRAGTAGRRRWSAAVPVVGTLAAVVLLGAVAGAPTASAAQAPVGLGSADSFAVLAGTTVTSTGPTVISGDLGVSPGSAITGFPPGVVINGTQHAADPVAVQAETDLTTAYNDAAARIPATVVSTDLGGQTLVAGVYQSTSGLALTGTVTLDAQGDPTAVFVFQAGSTLVTASGSVVSLIGGAQACNVFWQVGSSATLGTTSTFVGSILALTSATVQTGTTVAGRVLARNGAVTLDGNTIARPVCAALPTVAPTTVAPTVSPTPAATVSPTPAATTAATTPAVTSGSVGAAAGVGGPSATPTSTDVIPAGHPDTGAGGAAREVAGTLAGALAGGSPGCTGSSPE
jgi:hypothetical protein